MFTLTDRIALVTGGANGIGEGIARALAGAGATVVIADIDDTKGRSLAEALGGDYHTLDVTDQEAAHRVVQTIIDTHGRIDILASNTGIYPDVRIADMTTADWDKVFDINVRGMYHVCQPVLEHMKGNGYGRVILTSSITGPITGYPGGAAYGATKSAQLGFMRSAALEYARYGITVNAVQPGMISTEGLLTQLPTLNEGKAWVPMKTLGEPADIGTAVVFFASEEAKYITAQSLVVDGGQTVPETPDVIL